MRRVEKRENAGHFLSYLLSAVRALCFVGLGEKPF